MSGDDADTESTPLLSRSMTAHLAFANKFTSSIKIPCRAEPALDAEKTGHLLNIGEVVTAEKIVTIVDGEEVEWDHIPIDDMCFVYLGDDMGWVMNRNPVTNNIILDPVFDEDRSSCTAKVRFCLRTFFGTKKYEYSTTAVILLNGFFIWYEIDYPTAFPYVWINLAFSIVYCVEIGMKMFAFGTYFFYSNWNVFDLTVTGITILSDFAEYVVDGQTAKNLRTLAPVIRLLRLLRLTNMFAGLKSLMRSFVTSLGALGWIAVFVLIWFFISGCLTTILVGRKEFFPDTATKDPAEAQRLRAKFDTVPHSMYTLFEVMSMEGWVGVVRPIARTQPALVFFFFLFIFVAAFFLMNLVTAVVVDRTVQAQEEGEQAASACDNDETDCEIFDFIKDLKARNDGKDIIARETLVGMLQEDSIQDTLQKFDWNAEVVEDVLSMLDKDSKGEISLDKLQCTVSGAARPVSMMTLIRMQAEMTKRFERQEKLLLKIVK